MSKLGNWRWNCCTSHCLVAFQKSHGDRIRHSALESTPQKSSDAFVVVCRTTAQVRHDVLYSADGTVSRRSTEIDQGRRVSHRVDRADDLTLSFSFKVERERKILVSPPFNVTSLKEYVMGSLTDAIEKSSRHLRDPVGGSYSNWLVYVLCSRVPHHSEVDWFSRPLLQLIDALLVMGSLEVNDIQQLLRLTDPTAFNFDSDTHFDEGLLQMKLDEPVKLQMCHILQHLCDYQLQYRIEGMIAFSEDFVGRLQSVSTLSSLEKDEEKTCIQDQKRRYAVLKESSLPPALMAKKTREFRCPPKDQVQCLRFSSSRRSPFLLWTDASIDGFQTGHGRKNGRQWRHAGRNQRDAEEFPFASSHSPTSGRGLQTNERSANGVIAFSPLLSSLTSIWNKPWLTSRRTLTSIGTSRSRCFNDSWKSSFDMPWERSMTTERWNISIYNWWANLEVSERGNR